MAECAAVCEHAHLPLQSGSIAHPEGDAPHVHARALPAARRRAARRDPRPRARRPTSSSAFPARPRTTSARRSTVVEEVGFDSAFTFVYSPRAGTEAAAMPDQIPDDVKRDRIERLVEVVAARRRDAQRASASAASRRCSSRAEPHRPVAAARPHAPQHDRELLRRALRRASLVDVRIERGDVHDPARRPGRAGRRLMRILVTGSSGQIGTNLASAPAARRTRRVRRRQAPEHLDGRLPLPPARTSPGTTRPFPGGIGGVEYPEVDLVVHLAAHAKVHQLVRAAAPRARERGR